jgi:hypothetical protein
MQLSIAYTEIADIGNRFFMDEFSNENNIDMKILPVENGVVLLVTKIKIWIFNFSERIHLSVLGFRNEELIIKIKIKRKVFELFKKILFKIGYRVLKRYAGNDDDLNLFDYVYVSTSKIYIQVNELFKKGEIPVKLINARDNDQKLEIEAVVRNDGLAIEQSSSQ